MFKRVLACILAVAMLASFGFAVAADEEVEDTTTEETAKASVSISAPEFPFEDVEEGAVLNAVTYLYGKGITNGTSETTFEPEKTLDRAEFMTLLGRVAGAEVDQDADTGFTDVVNDGWSQGYIAWGVENGLIEGYGDGTFGQYDTLTKEHVNIIVGRWNEKFGANMNCTFAPFAEEEGNPTRGEIAVMLNGTPWVGGLQNATLMKLLLLPKTPASEVDTYDFVGPWGGEFPADDDFIQGIATTQGTDITEVLPLYELLTYTNPDEEAEELVKEIDYYLYDPVKNGADPEGKYPVMVWFHGAGNGLDGEKVIAEAGAILFASEEYQELMGTPCYVIVPVANEDIKRGWQAEYCEPLHDLLTTFMEENADNVSTLHINGTSSGGFMAWAYTVDHADEITSTLLMAPAFSMNAENVDEMLEATKNVTILHVHGKHDELCRYDRLVTPIEDKLNEAENYTLVPFEWVRNIDGAVASLFVTPEMGQHCICNQVAENLMFRDGTPMNENIPNGITGWYKTVFEAAAE